MVFCGSLPQGAEQIRIVGGVLQRQTCNEHGLIQQDLGILFGPVGVRDAGGLQSGKGGMLHVHLQNTLGLQGEAWLHGGKVLLHFEGHALAAGEADGMGLQLAGGLHLIHPASQRLLQEIQRLLMIRRLRLLLVPQLQIAVHGGAECLVAVGAEDIGDELVGLIGEVQDLHAAVLQQLRLGQMIHRLHAVAGGVIDILLLLLHSFDVLGEGHLLALCEAVEQQKVLEQFFFRTVRIIDSLN